MRRVEGLTIDYEDGSVYYGQGIIDTRTGDRRKFGLLQIPCGRCLPKGGGGAKRVPTQRRRLTKSFPLAYTDAPTHPRL